MKIVDLDLIATTTHKHHVIEVRCYGASCGLSVHVTLPDVPHLVDIPGMSYLRDVAPSQLLQEAMQWIDHSEWMPQHPGYCTRLEQLDGGWEWGILSLSRGDWLVDLIAASTRDEAIAASAAFVQRLVAWDALDLWAGELHEAKKLTYQEYEAFSNSAHPRRWG